MADDDRFASDVRIPQATTGSGRRKTLNFDVTTASSRHQVRDTVSGECFITIQHAIEGGIRWHGGAHSVAVPLADATVDDWVLAENTERSYRLAAGETHIAIIAGASGKVQVYVSSD